MKYCKNDDLHIMIAKTDTWTPWKVINSLVIYILRVNWAWFWLFSQYYFALSIKHLTTYLLSERVEALKVESMLKLLIQTIRVRHFQLSNDDFWVWTERKIGQWIYNLQLAPCTKEEKPFQYICDSVYTLLEFVCLFFWSVESLMHVCNEQILFRHL